MHPESPYRLDLEIAGITITLHSFQQWSEKEEFLPFVTETDTPDYRVVFRETEALRNIPQTVIHESESYRVHPDGKGGFLRSFFDTSGDDFPYALAEYDHAGGIIRIDCLEKGRRCVSQMHNSFFHLGFESILIHKNRLCLHAACVDTPLGGLLFSGPSGIGKSTQANLWQTFRGGKQINGDRPILSKDGDQWLAWGSPYAGSSQCHINENCPVSAIIMLQQGKTCSLQRLSLPEAFRGVWSGLTIHSWDKTAVEKALDLTTDLIGTVPVYRFCCTPDVAAVEYLEQELGREWAYE